VIEKRVDGVVDDKGDLGLVFGMYVYWYEGKEKGVCE
jgi:hypothetical protein